MGEALGRAPGDQCRALVSFLRPAPAGLAGVRSILESAAGPEPDGRPKPILVERTVTAPAVTEPDAAAAAAIADCFWCDENGLIENADGDLVPCLHDDPAEQPRQAAPAPMPEPAPAAPASSRSKPTPAAKRRPPIGGPGAPAGKEALLDA